MTEAVDHSASAAPLPGTQRIPPPILVLGSATSVQFGAALAVTLFKTVGPGGAVLLRVGIAAVIMGLLARPPLRSLGREQLRAVVLFGLVIGTMNLTFYEALSRLDLGVAVTIQLLGPLGLAVVLSQRRTHVALAVVALIGAVLITDPWGGTVSAAGIGLALIAALLWALYILAAQRASLFFDGSQGVAIAMMIAVAPVAIPGIVGGGTDLLSLPVLAAGAGVALASSVIPHSLETEALRRMEARVFGVLMSIEPAIAALAGLLVLDQRLGSIELVGMTLVVLASIGVTRTSAAADA